MWALLFVILTSGMIVSHSVFLASNRRDVDVRYRHQTLASTIARSGLRDALGWFRKQPTQPVGAFAPARDPAAEPPLEDTLDPTVGLVREFEIRGGLWGRYEVRRDEARDVSAERGSPSPGSVWEVNARSFVYQRADPALPFDRPPNRIVSTTALHSELRGITVVPPAAAPMLIDDPRELRLGEQAKLVNSYGPAVAYAESREPTLLGLDLSFVADPLSTVIGTPSSVRLPVFDSKTEQVFGMSVDNLRALSDLVVRRAGALQGRLADNRVVFVDGDLTLANSPAPLRGRLLLVVNGDLIAHAGNGTDISGIVFVAGDANVKGPFTLNGAMVVRGNAELGRSSGPGEAVTIRYDPGAIQELKSEVARYRMVSEMRSSDEALAGLIR